MTKPADKTGKALLESMARAQALVWGPLLFQAACALRDRGLLCALRRASPDGLAVADLARETNTSVYGTTVLLEAGLGAGLVEREDDTYRITREGYLIDRDEMTRVNMNFVRDVCYGPAQHLARAIETGKPAGLSELGDWPTVYEGLSELGEPEKSSWFEFDHFYSDDSFPKVLFEVFSTNPRRILDVGGNTGKFALECLRRDEHVEMSIADLPPQIASCKKTLDEFGFIGRCQFYPLSVLEPQAALPEGQDVIWMSQFLCCFSVEEIEHILGVARRAMSADTRLLIMDTLWDRQKNPVATMCLQATSLYFTTVANGNSRMYDGRTLLDCIAHAGLSVTRQTDEIGWGHTILECVK